jgi:hypothetical protein
MDIHSLDISVDRPGINERIVINDGYATSGPLVNISNIVDTIVVNVRDLHYGHSGIGHIDVLDITRAGAIPRNENFSRAKRKPSHSAAHSNSDVETTAADKCHQCR